MRFAKVSITKAGVHLVRVTKEPNGGAEAVDYTSPERPLSTFTDALQAFGSYVNDLLDVPAAWREKLTVTTVNLSESKDGRRGLQVSVSYAVAKADDKVVSLTTPIVHEASEAGTGTAFTLSDVHFALIDLLEAEATLYANGERAQGELFTKAERSVAADSLDERSAAAEVASTRKPKTRGKKATVTTIRGVGDVANPDATEPPSDEALRELFGKIGYDVPVDAIQRWASSERDAAQRYAREATAGRPSNMPLCLQRDSIKGLGVQASGD